MENSEESIYKRKHKVYGNAVVFTIGLTKEQTTIQTLLKDIDLNKNKENTCFSD